MNGPSGLRFLRPYLYHNIVPVKPAAYARLYANTAYPADSYKYAEGVKTNKEKREGRSLEEDAFSRGHYEVRVEKLRKADALHYPRMPKLPLRISVKSFVEKFDSLKVHDTVKERFTLCGKKIRLSTKS
jgi:hypothetical protein